MPLSVQLISKIAIWTAMAGWIAAMASWYLTDRRRIQNACWLGALILFAIHVVTAFEGFYQWNLTTALDETARLTEAVTGWRSSIGLWVNFAFFVALMADFVMRILRKGGVCAKQNRVVEILVIFMILNGAVVFAHGAVRWYGIGLLSALVAAIWYAKVRNRKRV